MVVSEWVNECVHHLHSTQLGGLCLSAQSDTGPQLAHARTRRSDTRRRWVVIGPEHHTFGVAKTAMHTLDCSHVVSNLPLSTNSAGSGSSEASSLPPLAFCAGSSCPACMMLPWSSSSNPISSAAEASACVRWLSMTDVVNGESDEWRHPPAR
jgi:hypothetical protein